MTARRPLRLAGEVPTNDAVEGVEITLASGTGFTVAGTLDEVEKGLSDAARSGQSRLAWFTERRTRKPVGVNPAHVAALSVAERPS